MTLTIHLSEDHAVILAAKAHAERLSVEEYACQVLEHALVPEWLQTSWQAAEQSGLGRLSMDEIDAEISAARQARRGSWS